MGFSLGNFLGPALNAATQITAGAQQGMAQREQERTQALIQAATLKRQQDAQALQDMLHVAQTNEANARASSLLAPPAKPKRSAAQFLGVDGKPVQGSMDESGTYYDATGNEITSPLSPFVKPESSANDRTPRTFTVDGQPIEGFSDKQGKFYDAQGKPVGGRVTPYVAPQKDVAAKYQILKDDKTGNYSRVRVDGPEGPLTETFTPPAGAASKPGSAQSAMALQRLGMSLGDVESAITEMDKFENDPKMRAKLTAYQQAAGSAAQVVPDDHAHGALGVLNNAAGSLLSSGARSTLDKDLQQYLRNRQRVGLAFTEALPRPNQALLGMEKGLSGIDAGGFSDPIIADVQARRHMGAEQLRNAINVLKPTPAAPQGGRGGASIQPQQGTAPAGNVNLAAPHVVTKAERAQLKAAGFTDAQITAKYGPPSDD